MTFDELFAEHNLTPEERKALVAHLAAMRAQKTVEALQAAPTARQPLPLDAIRDLVKECGLDWHRGFAPLFPGDETNRYAVLVQEVERLCGITQEGE